MGDRVNVELQYGYDTELCQIRRVYLYSHWGGSRIHETLKAALIRGRGRWGDPPYLARIIFSQMMLDESGGILSQTLEALTGFGIAPYLMDDSDNDTIIVDLENQTVGDKPFAEYAK